MAEAPKKREKFEALMQEQDHVLVHLDSRHEEVVVPATLSADSALTLKLSYAFQGETKADEEAISSFLKFDGNYFECILPWEAVWGLTAAEGEQIVWPEDMPKELLIQMAKLQLSSIGKKLFGKKSKDEEQQVATQEPAPESPVVEVPKKGKGGHLKLVK